MGTNRHELNGYLAECVLVPSSPGEHTFQNCTTQTCPNTAGKTNTRYPLGEVPVQPEAMVLLLAGCSLQHGWISLTFPKCPASSLTSMHFYPTLSNILRQIHPCGKLPDYVMLYCIIVSYVISYHNIRRLQCITLTPVQPLCSTPVPSCICIYVI